MHTVTLHADGSETHYWSDEASFAADVRHITAVLSSRSRRLRAWRRAQARSVSAATTRRRHGRPRGRA